MITPEYLDAVVKDTEETVSKVNMIIIRKIAQSIYKQWVDKGEINFMPSTLKQFKALMGTGLVAENIEYELAMIYPQIQKEIHKAFLNSASEMSRQQVDTAKQIIDIEGIDYDIPATAEQVAIATTASDLMLSKEQIRILENDYKRTNRTLKNITNTAGYSTEILYKDLCDELYMEVRQGRSMGQVLQEAITRFGKQGIKVQYGNRAVNLEVAVARAVRTAINQCNGEIVLQGCREMGVNYVKVSEHLGARVTDTDDYTNHSWWQGKVYSLDWNNPLLGKFEASNDLPNRVEYLAMIKDATERKKAEEYPDFIETCGYGDILGICGVNCRHSFYAWYPGINIDNGPRIDQEENKKRYAQEQKARAMEREIRSLKREIEATKAIDTDAGKARLKELKNRLNEKNLAYRDFVEKNKLNAANWRTKITGFTKADAKKADRRANQYVKSLAKDENGNIIIEKDLFFPKSVGAKWRNYNVELPNGDIVHFTEGTRITNIKTIAGKGRDRQIDEIDILVDRYGGVPEEWMKKKGFGHVDYEGESYLAEVHWYEEPTAGRHKFKVKTHDGNWIQED